MCVCVLGIAIQFNEFVEIYLYQRQNRNNSFTIYIMCLYGWVMNEYSNWAPFQYLICMAIESAKFNFNWILYGKQLIDLRAPQVKAKYWAWHIDWFHAPRIEYQSSTLPHIALFALYLFIFFGGRKESGRILRFKQKSNKCQIYRSIKQIRSQCIKVKKLFPQKFFLWFLPHLTKSS